MIDESIKAEIKRLRNAEGLGISTIAALLGIHHTTVRRALGMPVTRSKKKRTAGPDCELGRAEGEGREGGAADAPKRRKMKIDDYRAFILTTLESYPKITAMRLLQMVKARGYDGKASRFRELIATMRPRRPAEAYLRLRTLPGEQAQVDWAHCGRLTIGRASHILSAFVMVLSYSRAIYLEFFLGQHHANFLRGHQAAFDYFGGVPRVLIYDNLKSAVLERRDRLIRFHPQLFAFAGHHGFQPRAAAPYRGNEKGRVERAIRYIRSNFLEARTYVDLLDLNAQARSWCELEALERRFPEDSEMTVREALEAERPRLLSLPGNAFETAEQDEVVVGKTPYVRFDRNDYSVPAEFVKQSLVVLADREVVRILNGIEEVARHERSFDRGAQVEDPRHIAALKAKKERARIDREKDRLAHVVPSATEFLTRCMDHHGDQIGRATAQLLSMLDSFGAQELEEALQEAIRLGSPHPASVRHIIETRRSMRGTKPHVPLTFSDDARVRDVAVRPASLEAYEFCNPIDDEGSTTEITDDTNDQVAGE